MMLLQIYMFLSLRKSEHTLRLPAAFTCYLNTAMSISHPQPAAQKSEDQAVKLIKQISAVLL